VSSEYCPTFSQSSLLLLVGERGVGEGAIEPDLLVGLTPGRDDQIPAARPVLATDRGQPDRVGRERRARVLEDELALELRVGRVRDVEEEELRRPLAVVWRVGPDDEGVADHLHAAGVAVGRQVDPVEPERLDDVVVVQRRQVVERCVVGEEVGAEPFAVLRARAEPRHDQPPRLVVLESRADGVAGLGHDQVRRAVVGVDPSDPLVVLADRPGAREGPGEGQRVGALGEPVERHLDVGHETLAACRCRIRGALRGAGVPNCERSRER
jgi:hypothetical protein